MRQHHKKRNAGTDRRGQPRAVDPHAAGNHKEIIAERIENTAGQYAQCGEHGRAVIPQERRQQLIEQEKRECISDRPHVGLRQRKQRLICPEKGQSRPLRFYNADPRQK